MRRAMISVVLSIAEGSGKRTPADQRRFYAIARGSLQEVSAGIDIVHALGDIDETTYQSFDRDLLAIAKMLSRLIIVMGS